MNAPVCFAAKQTLRDWGGCAGSQDGCTTMSPNSSAQSSDFAAPGKII